MAEAFDSSKLNFDTKKVNERWLYKCNNCEEWAEFEPLDWLHSNPDYRCTNCRKNYSYVEYRALESKWDD